MPTNDSRGKAYGLDFFLSRADGPTHPRVTGWISYSLGKTQQDIYGRRVPFSYDRRHSLSVVWNWRAGNRFELAGTARAASGFPRTPPAGVRVSPPRKSVPGWCRCNWGRIASRWKLRPAASRELNAERMPMFARLDLRFGYRPGGASGRWQVYVESLNVLKHNNAWFMDADIVDRASGPALQEQPTGGLPRVRDVRPALPVPVTKLRLKPPNAAPRAVSESS